MRGLLVLVIVAGCGDGIALPDAATGGEVDPRGLVTLQLRGDAVGGREVYFQDVGSSVTLATRTDEGGRASALIEPGAYVTIVDRRSGDDIGPPLQLFTYTDVQPGDVLTFDLGTRPQQRFDAEIRLRISPIENAMSYRLYSPCGSDLDVAEALDIEIVPFATSCGALTDFATVPTDIGGRPLGYRARLGVAPGSVVDLRGPYFPMRTTIAVTGTSGAFVNVMQRAQEFNPGSPFHASNSLFLGAGHGELELLMPGGGPFSVQTRADTSLFPPEGVGVIDLTSVIDWGLARPVTMIDFTTRPLRAPQAPMFDPTSFEVRWTEDANLGAPGNVVHVTIDFELATWTAFSRRTDETLVRLPVLPQEMLRPRTTFVRNVALMNIDGGYDHLRTHLVGHWTPDNSLLPWPTDEPSGRVIYRRTQ